MMKSPPYPLDPFTLDRMKRVAGHFATGVVVVTGHGAAPIGFTCQSFVSLSLTPPLVAICPSRGSATWPRLRDLGAFCINVLADDQEALSTRFARSGTDRFASVEWRPAPSGAPILDGVCAWIDCRLQSEYDGGDHTIAVGAVSALGEGSSSRPLVFHRSGYGLQTSILRNPPLLGEGLSEWDW